MSDNMHYSAVVFVEPKFADNENQEELIETLESRIGLMDFPQGEEMYDYYCFGGRFKVAEPWNNNYIVPVSKLINGKFVPNSFIIVDAVFGRLWYHYNSFFSDVPINGAVDMRHYTVNAYNNLFYCICEGYKSNYAILLDCHI